MCYTPSSLLWPTALLVLWDCEAALSCALTAHYTARAAASQHTGWHSCLIPVCAHSSRLLRVLSQYHRYLATIFTHEHNSGRAVAKKYSVSSGIVTTVRLRNFCLHMQVNFCYFWTPAHDGGQSAACEHAAMNCGSTVPLADQTRLAFAKQNAGYTPCIWFRLLIR